MSLNVAAGTLLFYAECNFASDLGHENGDASQKSAISGILLFCHKRHRGGVGTGNVAWIVLVYKARAGARLVVIVQRGIPSDTSAIVQAAAVDDEHDFPRVEAVDEAGELAAVVDGL